ncbi:MULTISPECIES: helix-turn-helix transcriptional regulator [unclassified Paraflavitalea]|uniref:helix-turn-helix transcriptional regulator n=1 Tax=unclassified Paraflavitalea TaxID=2798305 RepID=UPI003D356DA8
MNEELLNEARSIMAGFFKERRLELGLTQQEVADRAGLARKTINAMEQGLFWLGMKQYLQVCHALHLFPAIAEMEADTPIAEALRKNWVPNPKKMSIEEALLLKDGRNLDPDQAN